MVHHFHCIRKWKKTISISIWISIKKTRNFRLTSALRLCKLNEFLATLAFAALRDPIQPLGSGRESREAGIITIPAPVRGLEWLRPAKRKMG